VSNNLTVRPRKLNVSSLTELSPGYRYHRWSFVYRWLERVSMCHFSNRQGRQCRLLIAC